MSLLVTTEGGRRCAENLGATPHALTAQPVDIGLGPYPVVTLKEARDAALENRRAVWQGRDPRRKKDAGVPTFEEAAEKVIKSASGLMENRVRLAGQVAADVPRLRQSYC